MPDRAIPKGEDAYWPTLPVAEMLPKAVGQIDVFQEFLVQSGLLDLMQRTIQSYNWSLVSSRIERVGRKGQYLKLVINDFASILRRAHTLLTAVRPGMEPRPINGDYTSRASVSLAKGCLEFYLKLRHSERKLKRAVWRKFFGGEMILFTSWNPNLGEIEDVDPETQQPVFGGDIDVTPMNTVDLIRDVTCHSYDECEWFIVRTRQNRWNVLALYGQQDAELRSRILAARQEDAKGWRDRTIGLVDEAARNRDTDQVEVFHLIHKRTPAVPHGRWVTFLDAETSLVDTTLDQIAHNPDREDQPGWELEDFVQRTASEECEGIPFGFSPAWEQLATQDAINIAESTLLTNLANHGIQTVAAPAGAVVKPSMLAEGMRLLELETPRSEGEVKAVNLLSITDAHIAIPDRWIRREGTNFGVNDTARGNPPQGIHAGNALALLQTQTIESLEGLDQAKDELWELHGSSLIKHFQRNVKQPRLAAIVGTGSEQHLQALIGADLDQIQRVHVDSVPYTSRTAAQKRDTAEFLAGIPNSGLTIEDVEDVLDTGALDPRLHKKRDKYLRIQKEHEQLLEGKLPKVLISDPHTFDIEEHFTLLDSPRAREDDAFAELVLTHILEHQNKLAVMPPMLAMIRGQPQLGQMAAGGAPAPSPQAGAIDDVQALAGQASKAPAGPSGESITLPATNPATGQPAQITMPNLPNGQDWTPGGAVQ